MIRSGLRQRWSHLRRSRAAKILLIVVGALIVLSFTADQALDRPIRNAVERRMNAALDGYTAHVRKVDFHLIGLSLTLLDSTLTQDAHPDPPVLVAPRLKMSVQWTQLIFGKLVANCTFENPAVYADLEQLQEENRDQVRFKDRGWQNALQAIYPLAINKMVIHGGSLIYRETKSDKPLTATNVELLAKNIRNVHSGDGHYPSPVRITGNVFEKGSVEIVGNADFLAKPHPGINAKLDLKDLDLGYFDSVLEPYALKVRKGLLSAGGHAEISSSAENVELDEVVLTDASVDYLYGGEAHQKAKVVAAKVREQAKQSFNATNEVYRIHHVRLQNGTVGLINRSVTPAYRLYVSGADFDLENLSNRAEDGVAQARLTGSLMGSGKVQAAGQFFPEGKDANFQMKLEIAETNLENLNDLLKAHGNFDVAGGIFSLYMDVRVKDRQVRGYVKPLFRDIDVYDKAQDKHEKPMHKLYEKMVGVAAKILENHERKEVATVAPIAGPVDNPQSNAMEIIGGLLRNAFVKSIMPGFESEVSKANPAYYRSWKKAKKESEKRTQS